ncbi:MAG: hypothetical protein PHE51_01855 [Eubacteriales bacterium]|nr:hypothetical protein [Eubacteriales bacterium]
MKKTIVAMIICTLLLTACNKLLPPTPESQKVDGEPNNTVTNQEVKKDITFLVEGQEEIVSTVLHKGDGYSIYIPAEGYRYEKENSDGALVEEWDSELNDDVSLEIYTYKNKALSDAQSEFLKENDDYIFEDINASPAMGKESDGDYIMYKAYENEGNTYIVAWEYPKEAAEGFGARLSQIADTFELSKTNS